MSRTAKIWLIVAGILVVLGPILIVCAAASGGYFSFGKQEYETVTHEIGSTFDQIAVDTNDTEITIATADEKQCKVVCTEPEKMQHTAQVENGTLVIRSSDTRKWYERLFSFTFKAPEVTVFLPQTDYASLQVDTHTGRVHIPSDFTFNTLTVNGDAADVDCFAAVTDIFTVKLSTGDVRTGNIEAAQTEIKTSTGDVGISSADEAGKISVTTDTGDIGVEKTSCQSLIVDTDTGDTILEDTVAENSFQIKSATGRVRFNSCDAAEITVKTTTGDVTGTLLSDMVFIVNTSTGDVNVPKTTSGGKCEITTSTGDIQIDIKNK